MRDRARPLELHRTGQRAPISLLFLCAFKTTFPLQRTAYKSVTMEELRIVKEGLKESRCQIMSSKDVMETQSCS